MKIVYGISVVTAFASLSQAAVTPYAAAGSTYSQNFDAALAEPVSTTAGTQTPYADGTTIPGWNFYADGAATQSTASWASDGASVANQQNLPLSLGSSSTFGSGATTDRALGAQTVNAAGTTRQPIHYAVTFVNNTGSTLTSFSLGYSAELWRVPSNEGSDIDGLTVDYKTGLTPTNGAAAELASSTTGWTAIAGANYTQTVAHTAVNQQLDGNLNSTSKSGTVTGLDWAPGTTLTIRWTDAAVDATPAALNTVQGIDNVTFSAAAVPEPATSSLIALGVAACLRRRRA